MLNSNIKKPVRFQRSSSSVDYLFLFALNNEDIDILKAYLSRESDSQTLQNMLSAKHYFIVDIAVNNHSYSLLDLILKKANNLHDNVINKAFYNRALNLITRRQHQEATMNIIFENFSNLDFNLKRTVLSMQQYGAFMRAAENGRLQAMELLLKQGHTLGIQEDMIKEQNYQAFRTAADRGNVQVVESLLNKAYNLNIEQAMIKSRSYYAFKAAVANNRLAVVDLLLSKTNNLIILQEMLSTTDHYPFWSAAERGYLDILELLWKDAGKVGSKFQKSMLDHKDYSAFQYAIEAANKDVLQWLWRKAGDLRLQKDMLKTSHFILSVTFKEKQKQYQDMFKWLKTEVDKIDNSLWAEILACSKMGNRSRRSYSCSSYVNRKDYHAEMANIISDSLEKDISELNSISRDLLQNTRALQKGSVFDFAQHVNLLKESARNAQNICDKLLCEDSRVVLSTNDVDYSKTIYTPGLKKIRKLEVKLNEGKQSLLTEIEKTRDLTCKMEPAIPLFNRLKDVSNSDITQHRQEIKNIKQAVNSIRDLPKKIVRKLNREINKINHKARTRENLPHSKLKKESCIKTCKIFIQPEQKIHHLKLQQKALLSFSGFLQSLPNTKVDVVIQGPYLSTFKRNSATTRAFSQSLSLNSNSAEQFLNNLQISAELYERIAQDKQISKREEKEVISLNNLLDSFETQLDSPKSSLPSSLSHVKSYKIISDLSIYVVGFAGNFAIHLGTSNHVVAIYRIGNDYAYFDSNFAYVQGIETADQLMEVIKEGIRSAEYEIKQEGLLIEHFYVTKANNELTAKQKEILTQSMQTERNLLALQDQKFGPINMDGQQIHRVTLYDIGTKLNSEGSVPVLINSDMSLNKKSLISYLKEGKITITAREYLDQLRGNSAQETLQIPKIFPFEGSRSEVKSAEKVRELISSDYGNKLKGYELRKLLASPSEQAIKTLHLGTEHAKPDHKLITAAGGISLLHGGYSIIHSLRHGDYESFTLGTGEMGFSLFSQLIEDRIVKATPQIIKQMKHSIYLSRGFAGVVASPFDIYDLIRSSIDASNSVKGSKEWRDNIASATFAGSSLVSSITFAAMSKPGIGTVVGLGIIVGQVVYNGISMVAEYDKNYQLTRSQKSRIFLHTLTLQEVPQDVQDDVIKQNIINDYAKKAWQYLQDNTQVVAYVMGLGNVTFQYKIYNEIKQYYRSFGKALIHADKITISKQYREPILSPGYTSINLPIVDQYDFSSPDFEVYHKKQTTKILPSIKIAGRVMRRQLFYPKPPATGAKIFCFSALAKGYCTSTAILDYQRINKSGKIVVDLNLIKQGAIIGSNKWQNHFNIYAGRPYIFGGNSTTNVFIVNKVEFSGGIVGGDNSLNILVSNSDAKYLVYSNENGIMSSCDKESCSNQYWFIATKISHFIGRKALPDSVNCAEDRRIHVDSQGGNEKRYDIIHNCKKVVVSPYTEITSENSDGGDIFYIKPDTGHVKINALPSKKQRFLIFPTTDLLNESNVNYSPQTNTFSIHVPMHNFTTKVTYYLSSQDNSTSYTYNFILVDKHGSVIEPLIEQKTGKIDLYYLRAETKLTKVNEILRWYRSVVKLEQVYGTVTSGNTSIIIGSDKSDIIPVIEGTVYVEGGKGGDLYNILPGTSISLKINNYSNDQAYDMIYVPTIHSMIKIDAGLYDLYLHVKDLVNYIQIKNYLFDKYYQHLMIVDQNKNAFIPLQLGSEVKLVPFYHATKNEYIFSLSANEMNSEMVIDAMLEEITVYRDGDNLLLTSNKPLIIKLRKFYSESWNNLTIHFIDHSKLNFEELLELAKLAVNYQEEVKNTYFDNVREYPASSSGILHDSTKQIGVIIFEHSSNIKVSVNNNDLVFTDGSHTINVKNWNDAKHRISVLRIDNKPKAIEVRGLDKFGLSEISEIQSLINKAILSNIIDKQINKLDAEVVNGIRYLLSVRGIEFGVNTDKVLGFDSIINQEQFVIAHSGLYTKDTLDNVLKNQQAVEILVWLISKGYVNLVLENSKLTRELLLNNLNQCFGSLANEKAVNRITRKLKTKAIDVIVHQVKSFIRKHKEALIEKITSGLENSTTTDIKEENHQRKRREVKNYEDQELFYGQNNANSSLKGQQVTSGGNKLSSWINTAFGFATKGISQLGGFFSSTKASFPTINAEHPSQQGSAKIHLEPHIDLDGTVLLLDVLIRKITGQNYIPVNQDVSLLEVQADALNITEECGKILSTTCNAEELIDLAEVQSNIFKAMMSGSGNKIPGILCSYVEEVSTMLEPEVAEDLLAAFQNIIATKDNKPTTSLANVSLSESQTKRLISLPNTVCNNNKPKTCLNNITIDNPNALLHL